MKKSFMPQFENIDQLFDHQLEGLKWTVSHAYKGSSFYKKQFEAVGVAPSDITSLDDLSRLPFTTGNEAIPCPCCQYRKKTWSAFMLPPAPRGNEKFSLIHRTI